LLRGFEEVETWVVWLVFVASSSFNVIKPAELSVVAFSNKEIQATLAGGLTRDRYPLLLSSSLL
jgi:hypothetical protein